MASSTEPRSGLVFGWSYGENGWNGGMDANLLRIGRFGFHLSALSRALATPPASPADGATYIVAASPTDAWAGRAGQVAVWVAGTPAGSWAFATPRTGWAAFVEDEQAGLSFSAGAWSMVWSKYAARSFTVKDRDLTAPPGSPVAGDAYIVKATATGAWVGHETQIAVYSGAAWFYITPRVGDTCFVQDETKLAAFYGGAWSAGIAI